MVQAELDRQSAEIARLRAALAPFALYADLRRQAPDTLVISNRSGMAKRQITMGDCYKARTALEQASDGGIDGRRGIQRLRARCCLHRRVTQLCPWLRGW